MGLFGLERIKKQKKTITPSERSAITGMVEGDFTNEEIREDFPDVKAYHIKNIRARAEKRAKASATTTIQPVQPMDQLAKSFESLAKLQGTLRANDKALIDGIRDEFEAAQPVDDDSTDDEIVKMFLEVMKQKLVTDQQPKIPESDPKPSLKPNAPRGALSFAAELTDDQLLKMISSEVPPWAMKLISSGKIKRAHAQKWIVDQRGVDLKLFLRAWKLIR